MKNAKQIVYVLIGSAMILLSIGLVFMKKPTDATSKGNWGEGENGSQIFSAPISSLVLEAGACKVEVIEGDGPDYIVDYEGLKYGTLQMAETDGNLTISFKQNDNWSSRMFVENEINSQKITLTIPRDTVFDSAVFERGAADIWMDGVSAKKLYITVGAGALHADNLVATEFARFKVGAGAFYAEDVTLTNAQLECGVGEMNLYGTFDGDSTVDCGVGSMELRVDGEQDSYHGDLNCGLGEIDFGYISIDSSGNKSYGTSSAERRMDIKCGIGKVDVRFNK